MKSYFWERVDGVVERDWLGRDRGTGIGGFGRLSKLYVWKFRAVLGFIMFMESF